MDDLLKLFGLSAGATKKRDDHPFDFVDSYTYYALFGDELIAYCDYFLTPSGGAGYGEYGKIINPTALGSLPSISSDGRCLLFNNNGMQFSAFSVPLPITIEFYAYNRSTIDWSCLVYFTQNGADNKKIQIGLQADYFKGEARDGASYAKTIQASTNAQNKWQHYAVVLTTTGHRLYINGIKAAENIAAVSPSLTLNRLNIGCKSSITDYPWSGAIYQFRVSNKERYTANFSVDLSDMPTPS